MSTRPRLLPWPDSAGKRCYLVADDGDSRLSRLADEMEAAQLTAGAELLGHAGEMLRARKLSERELRFLVKSLREALSDALRVAESRGGRLPACADSEPRESLDDAPESERGAYE
ncbi:hypothetical protein [Streptomyces malaysiensis]|uniref:hypothetical protein n=1 Tax=Streptomyces malaysiensis TaxID=92644 RepID=UPI002075C4E1|nr:hypothetical protein [Streptomyces malaysiensis]